MAGRKFRVVLIEEGLGNLRDRQYYTREALESAVPLFEGAKCNADHQNMLEEQIQPEGSVTKIVGHYENVACVTGGDGQAILEGDLVVLDGAEYDWAASLLARALEVTEKTDKQFVGLSINASGVSNSISLAEFEKSATIPKSAIPKLMLAKEQGIEEIELCTQLTEAESCDIVTRAGARGRVKKLLETETLRMALPKTAAKTAPKKTAREGDAPPPKKGADGGAGGEQPGHADADQDKQLIASMLKKALGDGEHGEDAHEAMKQAHEKAIKCGYEGEAAEEAAVAHMKMCHQTEQAEEGAEEESEGGEEAAAGGDHEDPAADAGAQPSKGTKGKGAMEREVIALKAQNAKLLERFARIDAEEARSKALRESGLSGEALKALGGVLRGKNSEASIQDAVKVFKEAYGMGAKENPGFIVGTEKTDGQAAGGLSFADCKEE